MKLLVLILALAISIPPSQAGSCGMDMDQSRETPQHMDGAADAGHDCCDEGDTDPQREQGCDGKTHCAPCFVSAPALTAMVRVQLDRAPQHAESTLMDLVLASNSSPPFRPPIS